LFRGRDRYQHFLVVADFQWAKQFDLHRPPTFLVSSSCQPDARSAWQNAAFLLINHTMISQTGRVNRAGQSVQQFLTTGATELPSACQAGRRRSRRNTEKRL
jgi:hypothetical protein